MVYFRKRLTPEILGEINEMILTAQNADGDDHDDDGSNGGTMIVDATCAPAQIKYPQDSALLNEARENTEALIDALHKPGEKKPRTYRKRAHKDYLSLVRTRKPGAKKIRKAIGKQLNYLNRNLKSIDALLASGAVLTPRQQERLAVIRKVYDQQKTMYDAKNHSVSDRIVSLSQPWLRPIVRGKAKAAVEFGLPGRRWVGRRRTYSRIKNRITSTNVSAWKWSGASVWQSGAAAWASSPPDWRRPRATASPCPCCY